MGFTILKLLCEERNILINIFQERNMKNITGNSVNPVVTDITFNIDSLFNQNHTDPFTNWESNMTRDLNDIAHQILVQNLGFRNKDEWFRNITCEYIEMYKRDFGIGKNEAISLYDYLQPHIGHQHGVFTMTAFCYKGIMQLIENYGHEVGLYKDNLSEHFTQEKVSSCNGNIIEQWIYMVLIPWTRQNNFDISIQNPNGANNPPDIYIRHRTTGIIVKLDVKAVKVAYTKTGRVSNAMNNSMGRVPNILDCIKVYIETGRITGELATIGIIVKYVTSSNDLWSQVVDITLRTYPEMPGEANRGNKKGQFARKHVDKKTGQTQNNNICMTMNPNIKEAKDVNPRLVRLHDNEKR